MTDDPLVPLHLLIFGLQAFLTSTVCLVEVWSWADRSVAQKQNISMLYGPYVALGKLRYCMHLDICKLSWTAAN